MSPIIHEYGNLKFSIGPEDPAKRKHVHVASPDGMIKVWLDPVEYDPRGDEGNVRRKDVKKAVEQTEVNHDKFKQDIDDFFAGKGVQKSIGKKGKDTDRPTG